MNQPRLALAILSLALMAIPLGAARGAGFRDLGRISFGPNGFSDDGNVIVGNGFLAGNFGFSFENGVEARIPNATETDFVETAAAVSADGGVIVGEAYRRESGVTEELPWSDVTDVAPDGSAIVGWTSAGALLRTGAGEQLIIAGDGARALGVSDGGELFTARRTATPFSASRSGDGRTASRPSCCRASGATRPGSRT